MPLIATVAWSYMTSIWGLWILPIVKLIPWQVWVGIGVVIGFLVYGHIRENRGYEKCHAQVVSTASKEMALRLEAAKASTAEAQSRAEESARRAQQLTEDLDATQKQVSELKTAKTVCLPKSITDQYQSGRMRKSK